MLEDTDEGRTADRSRSRRARAVRGRPRTPALAATLVLAGAFLAACGGGEGSTPTLTWYINPDSGGQAAIAYPDDPSSLTDEQWAHFVFFRDNPKGAFAERWSHAAGCRRWFRAVRDTRTHRFVEIGTLAGTVPVGRRGETARERMGRPGAA